MSALAGLLDYLKAKDASKEAKEKRAAKRAAKAKAAGGPAPGNPNVERFKQNLTDSGAKSTEGGTTLVEQKGEAYPEKPDHWKAAEAIHGPHLFLGRCLRAMAYSKKFSYGSGPEACAKVTQDIYRDRELSKYMQGCLEKDLSAGVPTEGGYLVPETTLEGVIELLRERCIIMRLGAQELPMDNGTLNLNKQTDGATAAYVGENQPVNSSDPDFGSIHMASKKMMVNVPISNDLLKTSRIAADRFVANDAMSAMKVKFDRTAFTSQGGNYAPRGLRYMEGLTTLSIAGALTADNIVNFIVKLFGANVDLDDFSTVGWAFGIELWRDLFNLKATTNEYLLRAQLELGKLLRYPWETTQFLARLSGGTAPMYFGAWNQFIIARQGLMEIDTSTEAAYNNAAGTVVSAWSRDQTVVRLIDRHDFALRQGAAICKCLDITTSAA